MGQVSHNEIESPVCEAGRVTGCDGQGKIRARNVGEGRVHGGSCSCTQ